MEKGKAIQFIQKYTMIIILVLVFGFFAVKTNGAIMLPANITNLIAQNAYVFVLASGMLLCILTGGNIDLSVGSVVCFVGALCAQFLEVRHMNWVAAVILSLLIGLAIGAWQAFWIAYVRIPPFITTLAGMLMFRGLSNVVLDGKAQALGDVSATFTKVFGGGAECYLPVVRLGGEKGLDAVALCLGIIACLVLIISTVRGEMSRKKHGYGNNNSALAIVKSVVISAVVMVVCYKLAQNRGVPTALVWVIIVVLVYGYITSKTTIGRHLYAVGGNEKATKLSGINTNRVYFFAYANMGFLAALAGLMTIARMKSAQPTAGTNFEMDAIGSCFIGGASAYGGTGTIPGVIVGAVLMGVINQGMSIMGTDQNWQKVIKGLVLLVAVIFDVVSKRKSFIAK